MGEQETELRCPMSQASALTIGPSLVWTSCLALEYTNPSVNPKMDYLEKGEEWKICLFFGCSKLVLRNWEGFLS